MNEKIVIEEFTYRFCESYNTLPIIGITNSFSIENKKDKSLEFLTFHFPLDPRKEIFIHHPAPHHPADVVVGYRFSIQEPSSIDYQIFVYENPANKKNEFLIISSDEIFARHSRMKMLPKNSEVYKLLLWIFPENKVFCATDISGEGEWYLLGSGLWEGTDRDFSGFYNKW